jgi:hypothetical protein
MELFGQSQKTPDPVTLDLETTTNYITVEHLPQRKITLAGSNWQERLIVKDTPISLQKNSSMDMRESTETIFNG